MMKKLFFAIFLFTVSAAAIPAQGTPEQAVLKTRDQFFDIKKRSMELERIKREADKRPASENITLKFPEIKEDFENIQKINSRLLQLDTVKTPVNYAAVLKFASEIKRRAVRLNSNLFPAEQEGENETKNKQTVFSETEDLVALFNALDKSIEGFVHNSMFQNLNLVNPADSLKAQKDLDAVIRVASAIKEKTKKLVKGGSEK